MLHEETGLHHQILQRNHHRLPCGEAERERQNSDYSVKIWQFTVIYFHKSSFMAFFGHRDESQSNGLSNDHQ